jgi:hypothetical protein
MYLFCGISTLLLVALTLLRRLTPIACVFQLLLVVSTFWMLGSSTPIGRYTYHLLPVLLQNAWHPEYALASSVLSLAILAGLGLQRLHRFKVLSFAIAVITASELMIVNSSTPFNTASLKEEPGYSQTTLEGSTEDLSVLRELTNKVNPPYRIDAMDPAVELLNAAPITGVPSASGYDPFALKRLMLARLLFASGSRSGRHL